eukprot:scaffold2875_cov218-Ochromonas_danica.AAC.1
MEEEEEVVVKVVVVGSMCVKRGAALAITLTCTLFEEVFEEVLPLPPLPGREVETVRVMVERLPKAVAFVAVILTVGDVTTPSSTPCCPVMVTLQEGSLSPIEE